MLLRRMQTLLARLYDAPVETRRRGLPAQRSRSACARSSASRPSRASDEQVFVVEDEQGVRIGLFIDRGVLERLARRDPLHALDEDNLADYCTALEGVSHFHYLVWSLARGRTCRCSSWSCRPKSTSTRARWRC